MMLPKVDDQPCQHSATVCCGFTCSAFTPRHTLESKASLKNSMSEPQKSKETKVNLQPLKSSDTWHPVGFFPGTFMPYIDLSADYYNSVTIDHNCNNHENEGCPRKQENQAQVSESRVAVEVPPIAQLRSTCSTAELLQVSEPTHFEGDRILPDTQRNSIDSSTSQLPGMITQNPDVPHTQRIFRSTFQLPNPNTQKQYVDEVQLLPETQQKSGRSSTSQINGLNAQRFNEVLLPDTQLDFGSSSPSKVNGLNAQHFIEELHLDTQRDPKCSSTSKNLSLNVQHLDDLLPDTPISYPSPPSSLVLENSTVARFESSSDLNNSLETTQKLSCRERKRVIVPMNRPANVTKAMKSWIAKTHYLLDPFRENDDCWFHPSPPPGRTTGTGTLRPNGKIQKAFAWQDHNGKHSIFLNFGVVSKLLLNKMSKQQKDGFINKQFHLSHLCGNWTCLNPAHTTVEPGSVNISRNICFSHRSGCGHNPQCMKDKKVFLDADGKEVDPCLSAPEVEGDTSQASAGYVDWDHWRYDLDEGGGAMEMDDVEESDMTASIIGDEASLALCG